MTKKPKSTAAPRPKGYAKLLDYAKLLGRIQTLEACCDSILRRVSTVERLGPKLDLIERQYLGIRGDETPAELLVLKRKGPDHSVDVDLYAKYAALFVSIREIQSRLNGLDKQWGIDYDGIKAIREQVEKLIANLELLEARQDRLMDRFHALHNGAHQKGEGSPAKKLRRWLVEEPTWDGGKIGGDLLIGHTVRVLKEIKPVETKDIEDAAYSTNLDPVMLRTALRQLEVEVSE